MSDTYILVVSACNVQKTSVHLGINVCSLSKYTMENYMRLF